MKIMSYVSPKILHGEQHGDLWLRGHHWGQNIHHYAYVSSWLSIKLSRLIKWPDNLAAGTTLLPCGLGWAPPSALAAQLSSGFPLVTDGGGKKVTKWLRSRQDNDYKREWQRCNARKKFSARHFWSDCVKYKATTAQYIGEICRCFNAWPKIVVTSILNILILSKGGGRTQRNLLKIHRFLLQSPPSPAEKEHNIRMM